MNYTYSLIYKQQNYFILFFVLVFLAKKNFLFAGDPQQDSATINIGYKILKKEKTYIMHPNSLADPKGIVQKFMPKLDAGGYYRGYFFSRKMNDSYQATDAPKIMGVGDGYFDPILFLYVGGNPVQGASFGTEIMMANPFLAYTGPGTSVHTISPFFNTVLRGSIGTKYGQYNILAGGIEWMRLSPFTFGSNVGYNRFSIFERRPWDPVGNLKTRYASYYYTGTINQDLRFGTQAFKGFMISGFSMPLNLNADLFYGKSAANAGFEREAIVRPRNNLGVRLGRNFKNNNRLSLNTYNTFIRTDSINATIDNRWGIFTTEFNLNLKDVNLNGEFGYGYYKSKTYPEDWSEGIILNLTTPARYTLLPSSFRFFQIGQSFTSNVAQFANTTIREVYGGGIGNTANVIAPFGGNMSNVGDLANNRRGVAANTETKIGKLKIIVGGQIESELKKLNQNTQLTYSHRINGLTWSRLVQFPSAAPFGPNARVNTFYRGAYEIVKISEVNPDSTPIYKFHYNSMDVQLKFKQTILGKDLYIYNLNSFISAQNKFSPIVLFNDQAYIRAQYHEAEMYCPLMRDVILSLYTGLEIIKGNKFTDTTTTANGVDGISGLPRNQRGEAFGFGLDMALSSQTSLFFRHRWFSFEDKHFLNERFNGHESTIEIKIFF